MTEKEAIEILQISALYNNSANSDRIEKAVKEAVEALEKQIPMKPLDPEMDHRGREILPCGYCGEELGNGDYCMWCGQRVER